MENNVYDFDLPAQCYACTACMNICPMQTIDMTPNERGFLNPVIGTGCVHCGRCKSVCQIGKQNEHTAPIRVVAAKSRDLELRKASSSGAVFTELCRVIEAKEGKRIVVYGAVWDEQLSVRHRAEDVASIEAFRGSKYVQSRLDHCLTEIRELLLQGATVVFSGTGCQCEGLRAYLAAVKAPTEKLYVIDLICHGVPSGKLWRDYLNDLEKRSGKKIVAYQFRNKAVSWHGIHPIAKTTDGSILPEDDALLSYGRLFGSIALNEACYHCKYANMRRTGDITIGDFWGVEELHSDMDDGQGVSIMLVNTEKGQVLMEALLSAVDGREVNDRTYLQPQLIHPTERNPRRNIFWKDYVKHGYGFVAKKYTNHSSLYRMLVRWYRTIRR